MLFSFWKTNIQRSSTWILKLAISLKAYLFRELLWITEGREQKHEQMDEEAELFTDQSLLF